MFTLSDIKVNDVVRTRCGRTYLFMKVDNYKHDGTFVRIMDETGTGYLAPEEYTKTLESKTGSKNCDIVVVYRPIYRWAFPANENELDKCYRVVYDRKENPVKEMTVAEIEKALGYSVKIIKEDK